jgi:transcriptional antiterminator RfaH
MTIEETPRMETAAWYLVHTKPRQERAALENLERQGYTAYLPLLQISTRGRRRKTPSIVTMFPRYLFVLLRPTHDNFAPIRSTIGVSRLVRFGDRYALLPDELIASLRAHADEYGVIEVRERDLVAGDPVVILDGAMVGYEAIFSETVGKARVALLLQIAGRQVRVEAAREAVRHR